MTAPPLPDRTLVDRVLTPDEATLLVGSEVPELPPTVVDATIALDRATGEVVYAYLPLGEVGPLRAVVRTIGYTEAMRSDGTRNRARVFGYAPRRPVRFQDGCNDTALARDDPAAHDVLDAWADRLLGMLRAVDPALADEGPVAEVLPDWRLGEHTLWTSGIVNRTSQLPYHRDRNNFPVWSAMPVLRRGVAGGHLHLPEYGATIACRDGWGVFFGGWQLVHGVTPMRLTAPDGYRYSVVYYSLRGMKDCATAAEETRSAWASRTARERAAAEALRDRAGPSSTPPRSTTAADLTLPSEATVKAATMDREAPPL